jgi:hypothetical protein
LPADERRQIIVWTNFNEPAFQIDTFAWEGALCLASTMNNQSGVCAILRNI